MKIKYPIKIILLPVVFLILTIFACNNKNQGLSQRKSDIMQKYLDEKVLQPIWGGQVFSSFRLFKEEEDTLYIWAYMQEYYNENSKIELGIGWSVPMKIYVRDTLSEITIKNLFIPGDGDMFEKDIRKNFPKDIQNQVLDFTETEEFADLINISKERAETYFKNNKK